MKTRETPLGGPVAIAVAAILGTLGATTPQPVMAQASSATVLEEITVTARRREESLQDVPIAITAIAGDALEAAGTFDIAEIALAVPSVTLEPSRATNTTLTAFIRGVGQQDPLAGFEQGVALYVDDVYIARPQGALLDIFDVERIEVLRGPQGTLYGRNAVGGAIKYVTRRLDKEPTGKLRASVGTFGQMDLIAGGSLPVSDSFRVGATIASLQRDGYGDNLTTGQDNYNKDILAYRVSAEFDPSDTISIRLAYDRTNDKSDPVAGWRPFAGAFSGEPVLADKRDTWAGAAGLPTTAGINGNNEIVSKGLQAAIEWRINDAVTLRSITADREDLTESVIDFDSLAVPDFDAPVIYDNEQFSQELQLLYSGDRWSGIFGVYYLDAKASNDFDVVLGQLVGGLGVTAYTGGTVDTEAWSAFADVTTALGADWSLSLGARYTEDKRSADIFRANYLGLASPAFGAVSPVVLAIGSDFAASRTYSEFTPRINLSYALNDQTNVYGGYSRGFKAGSFDPRGANFLTPEVEQGFDPEILDSFELGLKSTWLDGRARTNIAVFYSDYQDMQIPGSVGVDSDGDGTNDTFVGTVTNAAQSTIKGIELEGNVLLSSAWSLQFALSALDPKIDEWIVNGIDVSAAREIQNTPKNTGHLALTYSTPMSGGLLSASASASYRSRVVQFEIPNPFLDQESVTLVNASVYWKSDQGNWSVGLHGKNLTDKDVKTAGYCFGVPAVTGCPSALGLENNLSIFYGPPRTFTLTVDYRFQ